MTHTQTLIQTQTQLVHTQTLTKMMYTKTQTQGHTQIEGKCIILMQKPLHWRHPVATGRKNKPVSSKMTIFSFWYGIFCHFVFVFFGNYYLSTPLSLFWWVRGNIYKNILKESRRYTIRLCEPSTLLLLIYFIAKTQAMSSFSQIWEDQWPCWGHFGGQQLLPLWTDNW